jgi:cobalt-zinc-cadmium resistance protein CzcA
MFEKFIRFSIHYPIVVIVLTLFAAGYGVYSFTKLPIDAVPDITNNQVQINTTIPGFSPTQVEKQVTYVIETALAGVPGLELTRSISRNAFSQVTAIFDESVNIYFARQQINERLSEIKENLPEGADPKMGPISTGLGEIYMWTVDFKQNGSVKEGSPGLQKDGSYLTVEGHLLKTTVEKASYLRTVQDWIVKPQLKGIPGLAEIDSIGGYVKQYDVEPNIEKMIALGLSFDDIMESLKKNNVSVGPGYIERGGESFLIKSDERLDAPSQIESIVVATREGLPIRVRDIAEVAIGKEMRTGSATTNGHETVIGTAMMLIGANSRTVSQAVDAKIQEINKTLPPDIVIKSVLNRTKLVNATIKTVTKNLSEGALLVIAILFIFLGHFKAAFITALVIPFSMLLTATGMVQSHISGNLMSLGAIDFGLIVDGAVIITENCLRRLGIKRGELGRSLKIEERLEELCLASKEMIRPTVFGQAIIIVVYFPLLTLTGVEGKMFHPMAMTVIFALIAAFVLSLTFVPAMISLLVKGDHIHEKESRLMQFAKNLYKPLLEKSLAQTGFVIASGAAIFLVSLLLFGRLGQEFIPSLDEKDIAMHAIRIPSTSLTQSTEMQREVEKAILQFPEVDYVFSKTGTAEMASDPMPPNVSDTFIMLKPHEEWPDQKLTKFELIEKIEETLGQVPGNNYEFTQPIEMRFNELISGVRSDLAINIYGDEFDVMHNTAEKIAAQLQKIRGSADVKVDQTKGLPVLEVTINREAASRMGINVSDGLEVLSIATGGGKAGQLFEGDRRFDILVRLPVDQREDIVALGNLPIPLPKNSAVHYPHVPLSEIATLKVSEGLNEVKRENGKRFVSVQANVRNRDIGSYVDEAKARILKTVEVPEGYWLVWGGQFENLLSARQTLMIVVPLCLAMIIFILYTAFNSFKYALLVFTGVPLALSGGIFSLWLRGMPFSMSAAVGFIALSGIAVLNGLVLITCIDQLMKQTDDLEESIKNGALMRLRPVLMTALVASLGFIPMALATGTGAEVQKPLATVVIGGIVSSTLLTLVVLPALYKWVILRGKRLTINTTAAGYDV